MAKKYSVFGDMDKDNLTIKFNHEVIEDNEYMASIEAVKRIKIAFGHSVSIKIVGVQLTGEQI